MDPVNVIRAPSLKRGKPDERLSDRVSIKFCGIEVCQRMSGDWLRCNFVIRSSVCDLNDLLKCWSLKIVDFPSWLFFASLQVKELPLNCVQILVRTPEIHVTTFDIIESLFRGWQMSWKKIAIENVAPACETCRSDLSSIFEPTHADWFKLQSNGFGDPTTFLMNFGVDQMTF